MGRPPVARYRPEAPASRANGHPDVAVLVLIGAFVASGAVFLLLGWIVVVGIAMTAPHSTEPANAPIDMSDP